MDGQTGGTGNQGALLVAKGGLHAGSSLVRFQGRRILLHLITRDFFITSLSVNPLLLIAVVFAVYLASFFFWATWWWLVMRFYPGCLYGATTYVEVFTFSVVTQMTIGYGNTGPQACWAAAWLITLQAITGLLLESITIGIIFSRISHPKQRGRSIFISESAIVARRDGILKFMFRVADIRSTQVVDPKIKAFMYTWGGGRITAEGEKIPVRCEALELGYIDGMLLLPLIIEHTIDERSPLCGHTHDSLSALNAEIVVTFEGTTEFGNPFMARRSFTPADIHWGRQFADIIAKPARHGDTQYSVDLNRFHVVEPQAGLPKLPPGPLSQLIVNRAKRTVPYPLLGENTLVLSDVLCVSPNAQGKLSLRCRVADTYPNQMVEMTVRAYLYRWSTEKDAQQSLTLHPLEVGYFDGSDRLFLRLPAEVEHVIDEQSPLCRWSVDSGVPPEDRNSEVVVVINGYMLVNSQNRLRQRTYRVGSHVRFGYRFAPIVKHPQQSRDLKPRVRWAHFHDVIPDSGAGEMATVGDKKAAETSKPGGKDDLTLMPGMDLQRYQAMVAATGDSLPRPAPSQPRPMPNFNSSSFGAQATSSQPLFPDVSIGDGSRPSGSSLLFPDVDSYTATTTEAVDSVPHPAAFHPPLPDQSAFH